jgi:hypothetical protein
MMKVIAILAMLTVGADATVAKVGEKGDKTISKVIKMLQAMIVKSKADGEKDLKLFAKYKCYCDQNAEEKATAIADATTQIELLGGEIGALQAENGKLSTMNAELEMTMGDNERARTTAEEVRTKAKDDFTGSESDMVAAISSMDQAIDTLSAIGADQTALLAQDQFLSQQGLPPHHHKSSLITMKSSVKNALKAASVFLTAEQRRSVTSFIQAEAPFTGEYQSQSGEIVGILKNMRDTFKSNLASARASEAAAAESHTKFMSVKEDEFTKMKKSYDDKEKVLGENDDAISTKKTSKSEAETSVADDEEFLAKLTKMCAEKTKAFEDRKMVRANEEAAVAEAVSILNNDEAFETAMAVTSFIQLSHHEKRMTVREQVQRELVKFSKRTHSLKVARIAMALETGNPFNALIAEIDKMVVLIAEEEKADDEQKSWCDSEREENHGQLDDKTTNKESLEGRVVELTDTIENAETGLQKQLADENTKLTTNRKDQADEIETRGLENAAYQSNIVNLVNAEKVMTQALTVLKKFYAYLKKKEAGEVKLIQIHSGLNNGEEPAPPDSDFSDTGASAGGDAVSMLEFIIKETKAEETTAHSDEETAQKTFEDTMNDLKTQEATCLETIADLTENIASTEKSLKETQIDLEKTTKEKKALENYLLKIKPGCDFITENIDARKDARSAETSALNSAKDKLKGTPAYKSAAAAEEKMMLGKCAEKCTDKTSIDCKACIAGTSTTGYCAAHAGEPGC